jgi:hypothetical protein
MYYELTTLFSHPIFGPKVALGVKTYMSRDNVRGTFLGCWSTDIGPLGKLLVLRSYESPEELDEERRELMFSSNPWGVGSSLVSWEMESYVKMPFLPDVTPGKYGSVYEFRTYQLKPGGLKATIDAWQEAMPERARLSPLTINMYALDGKPRITHIWPFDGLDERARIRTESYSKGIWPPKGAPQQFYEANSMIALPTDFSPLR